MTYDGTDADDDGVVEANVDNESVNTDEVGINTPNGDEAPTLKGVNSLGGRTQRDIFVDSSPDGPSWLILHDDVHLGGYFSGIDQTDEIIKMAGDGGIQFENDIADKSLALQSENGGGIVIATDDGTESSKKRFEVVGNSDGDASIGFKNLNNGVLVDGSTVASWTFGSGISPRFADGVNMTTNGSDIIWTGGSTHEIRSNNTAGAEIQFEDRQNSRDWMRLPEGETPVFYSPNDVTADSVLDNSEWTAYLDETNDNLELKAQYSDGTVRTGTVSLS